MTLPRVSAGAVSAGMALDRADTEGELEAIWVSAGFDAFRGADRRYLISLYRAAIERFKRQATALKFGRAS